MRENRVTPSNRRPPQQGPDYEDGSQARASPPPRPDVDHASSNPRQSLYRTVPLNIALRRRRGQRRARLPGLRLARQRFRRNNLRECSSLSMKRPGTPITSSRRRTLSASLWRGSRDWGAVRSFPTSAPSSPAQRRTSLSACLRRVPRREPGKRNTE
jgi:hypothetical protein